MSFSLPLTIPPEMIAAVIAGTPEGKAMRQWVEKTAHTYIAYHQAQYDYWHDMSQKLETSHQSYSNTIHTTRELSYSICAPDLSKNPKMEVLKLSTVKKTRNVEPVNLNVKSKYREDDDDDEEKDKHKEKEKTEGGGFFDSIGLFNSKKDDKSKEKKKEKEKEKEKPKVVYENEEDEFTGTNDLDGSQNLSHFSRPAVKKRNNNMKKKANFDNVPDNLDISDSGGTSTAQPSPSATTSLNSSGSSFRAPTLNVTSSYTRFTSPSVTTPVSSSSPQTPSHSKLPPALPTSTGPPALPTSTGPPALPTSTGPPALPTSTGPPALPASTTGPPALPGTTGTGPPPLIIPPKPVSGLNAAGSSSSSTTDYSSKPNYGSSFGGAKYF